MKRKRMEATTTATAEYLYLPDECWEHVFKFLNNYDDEDNRYLKSISVVSKQFFSVTNRLRSSLTICDPTLPFLSRLFHRFINLTSLDLTQFQGDLNKLLRQISLFSLNLTSLNLSHKPTIPINGLRVFSKKITSLKSLTCSNIHTFTSTHLFLIVDCFPLLEQLDLAAEFSDHSNFKKDVRLLEGFEALTLALFKLRKVNFSSHHYINDKCIFHLFNNCKLLEEVIMIGCSQFTKAGIAYALREKPTTLKSLSITNCFIKSHFIDSLVTLKGLTCLDLSYWEISDDLLSSISIQGLPLRNIILQNSKGYSYAGIFGFLSKCKSIQHLNLRYAQFLNDHHVVELSLILVDLVSINLSKCSNVTYSALFALVKNCPSLSEIQMEGVASEQVDKHDYLMDFGEYPQLKSLYLGFNPWLNDETIVMITSAFPNLHLLDLKYCINIFEGIVQVLKRCSKITHLNLWFCLNVKLHGMDFEVPKLKMLNLSHTYVDDEELYAISKSCSNLLQLLLYSCIVITEKGVKHVVDNCAQLREIDLGHCYNVHTNAVASLLFLRPSLRKMTVPPHFRFTERRRKLFSLQGCIVNLLKLR